MPHLTDKRVAVLSTDGFEDAELTEPVLALTEAGALVDIVSTKSGTITGKNGHESRVDLTTADAEASNYDALVLPGGVANGDTIRMDANAVSFTREFFEQHKPVAAISQSKQGPNLQQRKRWQGFGPCPFVDLRREFENPCPHLKTLSLRRSRGFYDHDHRSSEPTVSDSRGRVVRSLGMAQTLLRPEQVDDLVAQYREGATLVELASVFGVNRRTVATHLTRREVTIRRGRFDPSRIHEAADLYLSGLTLVEVGMKVGSGPQAVQRALASHGVVIRPGGRRGSRIIASAAAGG